MKCLYFVATGTLDDILWKLIEKKFKELGEFVEGKEKLKMVVDRVFKDEEELNEIFNHPGEGSDKEEDNNDFLQPDAAQSGGDDIMPLDIELEHDIEEMGREEQEMLASADRDEDDGDGEATPLAVTNYPISEVASEGQAGGRTVEDAIALSDDDDDDKVQAGEKGSSLAVDLENNPDVLNVNGTLPECKIYKIRLAASELGCEIDSYQARLVVRRKTKKRMYRLGPNCKPDVGDILVAINSEMVPPVVDYNSMINRLRGIIARGTPTELIFAEDAGFTEHYKRALGWTERKQHEQERQNTSGVGPGAASSDDVILLE